jgi:hypothetical protein
LLVNSAGNIRRRPSALIWVRRPPRRSLREATAAYTPSFACLPPAPARPQSLPSFHERESTMRSSFLSVLLLAVVVGCVPSLHPVYHEKDLIFDPTVVGVWRQPNAEARWEFTQRDEKSYRLRYTDEKGQQGQFIAHLAEIDGTVFLDLFPEEVEPSTAGFYRFHLVPIHTIYLVRNRGPVLELAAIDYEWLDQHLTKQPQAIEHATFNGRKMITAPTADVQAFVLENKDKFTGEFQLERRER